MDAKTNIKEDLRIGHVGPEAAVCRTMGPVGAAGVMEIDVTARSLDVKLTDAELTEGKTKWRPVETNHRSGALWEYAGSARESRCYAGV